MKTLLSAIALSVLSVSAVHAEMAIDGKDYETTIPVTMENFDHQVSIGAYSSRSGRVRREVRDLSRVV